MAWGSGSAAGFAADSANFDALGVSHLLSFNEPDVSSRHIFSSARANSDGILLLSNNSTLEDRA